MGTQWGATAAVLTYSMIKNKGFNFLPIRNAAFTGYAKIGLAFMTFYMFGASYCMGKFGDANQANYLNKNKSAILRGDSPWEPKV